MKNEIIRTCIIGLVVIALALLFIWCRNRNGYTGVADHLERATEHNREAGSALVEAERSVSGAAAESHRAEQAIAGSQRINSEITRGLTDGAEIIDECIRDNNRAAEIIGELIRRTETPEE